ncbi:MAG TPA: hypothetical protein VGN17_02150 [Bryobacteraceae bacterium]|jgi:hypothetical protein
MTIPARIKPSLSRTARTYQLGAELFLSLTLFLYVVGCVAARTAPGLHGFIEFLAYVFQFHPVLSAGQGG